MMLSQMPPATRPLRPTHRRQQSTTGYEAPRIPISPATTTFPAQKRIHRRGMSLDQPKLQFRNPFPSPSLQSVSMDTNPGHQQQYLQHPLQVAQQQHFAQPGNHLQHIPENGTTDQETMNEIQEFERMASKLRAKGVIPPSSMTPNLTVNVRSPSAEQSPQISQAPSPCAPRMLASRPLDVAPMPNPSMLDQIDFPLTSPASGLSFGTLNIHSEASAYDFPSDLSTYSSAPGLSPARSSFSSSPILTHASQVIGSPSPNVFDFSFGSSQQSTQPTSQDSVLAPPFSPSKPHHSHTRGISALVDLNIAATVTDTGVAPETVQSYISELDKNGKWTCMYEDCGRTFARKENIRSHVQTHLNDRQYLCLAEGCGKRFVRQHDLKRHAKIHDGEKPYVCKCGCGFARHDALTRHRQRGICNGTFEGVVRKDVKRGRPRKQRPTLEDRAEKATKTRMINAATDAILGMSSSPSPASSPMMPLTPPESASNDFSFSLDPMDTAVEASSPQMLSLEPDVKSPSLPPQPQSLEEILSPQGLPPSTFINFDMNTNGILSDAFSYASTSPEDSQSSPVNIDDLFDEVPNTNVAKVEDFFNFTNFTQPTAMDYEAFFSTEASASTDADQDFLRQWGEVSM